MPLTLTLPVEPSQSGYSEQDTFRVQVAQFGDGYEQRVVDGINATPRSVSLTCAILTASEKTTLVNFLKARGGWDSFYYTLPSESTPRLWVCDDSVKTSSVDGGVLWDVSFSLREVFDYA